ncbi:hypothetical protein C5Y93_19705 [Blastopirellula marina]|uniref:Leucine Rich repeats (2 copies) n=1 Tax=Blastopirellula marina TaxID=124 RepID=A0A2S8GIQ4_9BACT|nr:hypothetical protein C5Y93_19705 [Blastopirellula marina]
MLVVILLLAIPLGWLAGKISRSQRETSFANQVRKAGGVARFDYDAAGLAYAPSSPKGHWLLRAAFGKNLFSYLCVVDLSQVEDPNAFADDIGRMSQVDTLSLPTGPLSDGLIDNVAALPNLWNLTLDGSTITPEQMRRLCKSNAIGSWRLGGAAAADEILEELQHADHLPQLTILHSPTTDRGLKAISEIDSLHYLAIDQAPAVTNQGFEHLVQLPNLTFLRIDGTQITGKCVDSLAQMPKLEQLTITPGMQKLQYQVRKIYRLDTGTPVDPTKLSRFDCGPLPADFEVVKCVEVQQSEIRLEVWDLYIGK